jgi:hypothetical protein
MGLVRLIYASQLAPDLGPAELWDILKSAREHNAQEFVTGLLCYDSGSFLQCLEGERERVNALYRAIVADDRHSDVTLLDYADIDHRIFGRWAMAYLKPEAITQQLILEYGENSGFDPFKMTAAQALGFIEAVARDRESSLDGGPDGQ